MSLYFVHPSRKREVWKKTVMIMGVIPTWRRIVVYWNVNSDRGIWWLLENDRKEEPDYVTVEELLSRGWQREG